MSTSQEHQPTSLNSIHIQTSHNLNIAGSTNSNTDPLQKPSLFSVFVNCFIRVVVVLFWFLYGVLKKLFQPVFWVIKKICTLYFYIFLVVAFLAVLCFVGILSSLTFPFLLVSLLVLRFSQFFKRGEDYDEVTQVKMLVERYLFLNCVLFALAVFLLPVFLKDVTSLNNIKIMGMPFLQWGKRMCTFLLFTFGARFILIWTVQKYMPRMTLEHNESGSKVLHATFNIVDCLNFWFFESVLMENVFPEHDFYGLRTEKWIEMTIIVFIGWNVIELSTHTIVWSSHRLVSRYLDHVHDDKERSHRYLLLERLLNVQFLVYFGSGMKRSFNFMLSSSLLLLVWVFYFGAHMKKTGLKSRHVWEFGTWTCLVLLILSLLWVLKDLVLLSWEANAVYNRLSSRILEARKSLYFLGILGRHSHDILKLRYEVVDEGDGVSSAGEHNKAQIFLAKNLGRVDTYYRDERDEDDKDKEGETKAGQLKPKLSKKKRARVKRDLIVIKDDTMTTFHLQQVAEYFLTAANALLKETYTSDFLQKLNSSDDNREFLEKLINGKSNVSDVASSSIGSSVETPTKSDWDYFDELLDLNSTRFICHDKVKTWMEKSHNKCLFLANTLRSAKEVVGCLNSIMSVCLIVAAFILWLICTGLADTKVLVLVASPLIAATFIFGDTCKCLFQGIMFVYVVHPLDVGDICFIDDKLMEVKAIGVWKTTFSKIDNVGTHEDVIYPNSELATKMFINHRTEFDWSDFVEFDVEYLDEEQIEKLKLEIEKLLDGKKDESMPGSHSVSVIVAGKEMKIAVRFKHNIRNVDMTYFECVKEKDNLRSTFILDVQDLIMRRKRIRN